MPAFPSRLQGFAELRSVLKLGVWDRSGAAVILFKTPRGAAGAPGGRAPARPGRASW